MGYKPLNRPNNFMLGSKPWFPAVYDENITPLEQMNKLAEKLNEIVGDDTNVKNDVDKLLGLWKPVFMVKAGYCPPIETIFSENNLFGEIICDNLDENGYITNNIYSPIKLTCKANKNCNMFWEYEVDGSYTLFEMTSGIEESVKILLNKPITNIRVKLQTDKYTSYAYIILNAGFYLYEDLDYTTANISTMIFYEHNFKLTNKKFFPSFKQHRCDIYFYYDYGMGEEEVFITHDINFTKRLIDIEPTGKIYTYENWFFGDLLPNNGQWLVTIGNNSKYSYTASSEFGFHIKEYIGEEIIYDFKKTIKNYNDTLSEFFLPEGNFNPNLSYSVTATNLSFNYGIGTSLSREFILAESTPIKYNTDKADFYLLAEDDYFYKKCFSLEGIGEFEFKYSDYDIPLRPYPEIGRWCHLGIPFYFKKSWARGLFRILNYMFKEADSNA